MKKNLFILFILGCINLSSIFAQKTVYVRESGIDSMEQPGTLDKPCKTINYALSKCAQTGDTIDVLGTIITADSLGNDNKTIAINGGKGVTIIGHGTDKTILQPAATKDLSNNRIFSISDGAKVVMKNLSMRWGNVIGQPSENGGCINIWQTEVEFENVIISESRAKIGGAISIQGSNNMPIVLRNCVLMNNQAFTYGGGISMNGTGNQGYEVQIYSSLISGNATVADASRGGGIWMDANDNHPGVLSIYNSTISFNVTPTVAAALATTFRTAPSMALTLWGNTIAYNRANGTIDGTNSGPGAWVSFGTKNLKVDVLNNLFMENWGKAYGAEPGFYDVNLNGPTLERVSYNIFTNNLPNWYIHHPASGTDADPGNTNIYQDNTLVLLAKDLADNGGLTKTLSVGKGSVAIDAGIYNPLPFMQIDQRGETRSMTPTIGAYEYITNTGINSIDEAAEGLIFYNNQNQELIFGNNAKNVTIYNIAGQTVMQKKNVVNTMNVSALKSNTIYLTTILFENGLKSTFKFVK